MEKEVDVVEKKNQLSVVAFLSLGYLITITIGTLLLLLPFSVKAGEYPVIGCFKDFINLLLDTLLTATSATCVTGIITYDTFLHWTLFGQIVIIILIQIGGLGFMTIITLLFMMLKKNITLYERSILMQSAGSYNISGVINLIKTILIGTLIIEGLGAICLFLRFKLALGFETGEAIYFGIFHSISAFCNAGFDLMSAKSGIAFGSLTSLYNDYVINIIIMALIYIGALGYVVWIDILKNGFKFKKYQLHTKIVLVANLIILLVGALLYFIFEFNNTGIGNMGDMNIPEKILCSFFMAVTPRTAGFNTIELTTLTPPSKLLTIILMFIGGNSGSTAGGVKVTTVVVVLANLISNAKNEDEITMFKRKISNALVKQASSLFLAYILVIFFSTFIISYFEPIYELEDVIVEVTSAICTVGIGIIPNLTSTTMITRIILILLMYIGRLGAFTLFSLITKEQKGHYVKSPEGNVLVG